METATISLTEASSQMFGQIVRDLGNWGGKYSGNYDYEGERKGNLTDLKKKGLVITFRDSDAPGCTFVQITELGVEYAKSIGMAEYV